VRKMAIVELASDQESKSFGFHRGPPRASAVGRAGCTELNTGAPFP
jgi:hypothetical protein